MYTISIYILIICFVFFFFECVCANSLKMLRSIAEPVLFSAVNFLVSSLSISVSFAIHYSHEFYTNEDITFHFQLKCDCTAWRGTACHRLSIPPIIYISLLFHLFFLSYCCFCFVYAHIKAHILFTFIYWLFFYINLFCSHFIQKSTKKKWLSSSIISERIFKKRVKIHDESITLLLSTSVFVK